MYSIITFPFSLKYISKIYLTYRQDIHVQVCSVQFCSVLFCSVLFCSVLFRSVLFCSVLLCSVLFCSVLFCSVLFCSVLSFRFPPPKKNTYPFLSYFARATCTTHFTLVHVAVSTYITILLLTSFNETALTEAYYSHSQTL